MTYPARDRIVEYKGPPAVEDGDIVSYVYLRPYTTGPPLYVMANGEKAKKFNEINGHGGGSQPENKLSRRNASQMPVVGSKRGETVDFEGCR